MRPVGGDGPAAAVGFPPQESALYTTFAPYYDALYSGKDYRTESRRLIDCARGYGAPHRGDWLDVACGTGRHLEHLRRAYRCVGIDSSRAMLRIARRRLPGVELYRRDMRTFDLGRKFDVVSCLFSAIGHLSTERQVETAFRRFAGHLRPGGIVLIEPWVDPHDYRVGGIHLRTYDRGPVKVARMVYSDRRGSFAVLRTQYLIAEKGRGVRVLSDVDRLRMIPRARLLELLRRAGLSVRWRRAPLWEQRPGDRGLLVGARPRE